MTEIAMMICDANALRRAMIERRKHLSIAEQNAAAEAFCAHIIQLEAFQQAQHIALYWAVQGEMALTKVWQAALLAHKHCYFPVIQPDATLIFLPADAQTLFTPNQWHIPEPQGNRAQCIALERLEIMIVPLTAFDKHGHRLGMGGGFYDRTLASIKNPRLWGAAYDFQEQALINPNPWDIPLAGVITPEQGFIKAL